MKSESETKKTVNHVIGKCMKHLDVIGADDKTKQIVYMYMKILEDEIRSVKEEELGQQPS